MKFKDGLLVTACFLALSVSVIVAIIEDSPITQPGLDNIDPQYGKPEIMAVTWQENRDPTIALLDVHLTAPGFIKTEAYFNGDYPSRTQVSETVCDFFRTVITHPKNAGWTDTKKPKWLKKLKVTVYPKEQFKNPPSDWVGETFTFP